MRGQNFQYQNFSGNFLYGFYYGFLWGLCPVLSVASTETRCVFVVELSSIMCGRRACVRHSSVVWKCKIVLDNVSRTGRHCAPCAPMRNERAQLAIVVTTSEFVHAKKLRRRRPNEVVVVVGYLPPAAAAASAARDLADLGRLCLFRVSSGAGGSCGGEAHVNAGHRAAHADDTTVAAARAHRQLSHDQVRRALVVLQHVRRAQVLHQPLAQLLRAVLSTVKCALARARNTPPPAFTCTAESDSFSTGAGPHKRSSSRQRARNAHRTTKQANTQTPRSRTRNARAGRVCAGAADPPAPRRP
jgi:hypothetical protein